MIDRRYFEDYIYDGHKDAFGVKGRHYNFDAMTDEELVREAEWIEREIVFVREAEEKAGDLAVEQFELRVAGTIRLGAGDRKTALRWMLGGDTFENLQEVEGWVYNQGILFTEYGAKLVKELVAEWN